jgi:hypothetical protein
MIQVFEPLIWEAQQLQQNISKLERICCAEVVQWRPALVLRCESETVAST